MDFEGLKRRAKETLAGEDEYLYAASILINGCPFYVVLAQFKGRMGFVRVGRRGEVVKATSEPFERDFDGAVAGLRERMVRCGTILDEKRVQTVPKSMRLLAIAGVGVIG